VEDRLASTEAADTHPANEVGEPVAVETGEQRDTREGVAH